MLRNSVHAMEKLSKHMLESVIIPFSAEMLMEGGTEAMIRLIYKWVDVNVTFS